MKIRGLVVSKFYTLDVLKTARGIHQGNCKKFTCFYLRSPYFKECMQVKVRKITFCLFLFQVEFGWSHPFHQLGL